MRKLSFKTALPAALLIATISVLAALTGHAFSLNSRETPSAAVILPAVPTSDPIMRTAAPQSPTAAPTAEPILFNDTADDDVSAKLSAPFWSEGSLLRGNTYKSPTLSVSVTTHVDRKLFGKALVYYVADVRVSDVTQIKTAAFSGNFANTGRGRVSKMAHRENALIAISGDYCGNHGDTLIIRNGEVYRQRIGTADICLLLKNGEMRTMRSDGVKIDQILALDPWQAWQFGPALLNSSGSPRKSFPVNTIGGNNPRCCIGYYEPGHYCFVLVDGRQKASRGLTLPELAKLMQSLGCSQAYNLDGGASAHLFWQDRIYNAPSGGGRVISDIIYIVKEDYPESGFYCGKAGLSE